MKKLILILILCTPAWATFTVVQHTITAAGTRPCAGGTSCHMTVPAIGAGHLLILMHGSGNDAANILQTGMTGGGTWVHPGGDAAGNCFINSNGSTLDAAFVLSSTAGDTTISWSKSGATFHDTAEFYEISFTGSSVSFEVCGTRSQAFTTTPAGVTLTLSGSNDCIIQGLTGTNNAMSTIDSGYVGDFGSGDGNVFFGFASLINTASGTAPTWGSGNNQYSLNAIAFTEASGATGGAQTGGTVKIGGTGKVG